MIFLNFPLLQSVSFPRKLKQYIPPVKRLEATKNYKDQNKAPGVAVKK